MERVVETRDKADRVFRWSDTTNPDVFAEARRGRDVESATDRVPHPGDRTYPRPDGLDGGESVAVVRALFHRLGRGDHELQDAARTK